MPSNSYIGDAAFGIQSAIGTNSTITPTTSFTGTAELNPYPDVMVSCFSDDQDGVLYFDFSVNGTDWRTFPSNGFTVTAGIHEFHIARKGPRYFRARFTSSSAPTTFQLYSYYGQYNQANAPLNQVLSSDSDATVVKAVTSDFLIPLGLFSGIEEDAKFGRVEDIDAADNAVDVWAVADDTLTGRSDTKVFPTSASTLYMASDSSADQDIEVTVIYLDTNGIKQTVTANTDASDGQTPVSLAVSGLDSNRAYLSGDNESNAGNIYISNNSSFTSGVPSTITNTLCMIPAGYGQTQQAMDTVPADKKLRMKRMIAYLARASGAAGSATVYLKIKPNGGSWRVMRDYVITDGSPISKPIAGLVLDGLTQWVLTVNDVSDTDTTVFAEVHYDMIDA